MPDLLTTHVFDRGGRGLRSPVDGLAVSVSPGQPKKHYADQPQWDYAGRPLPIPTDVMWT